MPENNSPNDPSAEWPEEIKQAYDHLKLPTLYDAFLANEKLSLEIRRQDRELRMITEKMNILSNQLASLLRVVEEEWDIVEEEENALQSYQMDPNEPGSNDFYPLSSNFLLENQLNLNIQAPFMLMETYDDTRELSQFIKQSIDHMVALLPKKEGFIARSSVWQLAIKNMFKNAEEYIEKFRYQLLARLEDLQIELINPQLGETLDQSLHHVLDYSEGKNPGTVSRVVRLGYRQGQDVLRLADVFIDR